MKKYILSIGFILVGTWGFSQSGYSQIDRHSVAVPESIKSPSQIAKYLTKNLSDPKEKARAIFVWICHNIKYDLDLLESIKVSNSGSKTIEETLKTKKGVCQNYAELFVAMSDAIGLESYVITGYTKDPDGTISAISHAWNAIKIDAHYYLIDATWSAGYVQNDQYFPRFSDDLFLVNPSEFLKTHMPFDPIWQFHSNPINNDDFVANDFSKLKTEGKFMFADSISILEDRDELSLLQNAVLRMSSLGSHNPMVKEHVNQQLTNIGLLKYNLAAKLLNEGIDRYRSYIDHRNNRFRKPKLEDAEIRDLFNAAEVKINLANSIFTKLSAEPHKPEDLLEKAHHSIADLLPDLKNEKVFLEKYFRTWRPFRFLRF